MPDEPLDRRDYEALLATRGELGPDYEAALVDSFAERVEREIQRRSAELASGRAGRDRSRDSAGGRQLTLGIVSMAAGIPITAISAALADLPGLGVAWVGIAAVNVAHALQGRRRD